MNLTRQQITDLLEKAHIAITNALKNPEIMEALVDYAFDRERMEKGLRLQKRADDLTRARRNKWTRYQTDGSRLNMYWNQVKETYNIDIQLARLAFRKSPGMLDKLAARGPREKAMAKWLEQARVFYSNAIGSDEVDKGLKKFGLTRKKLKEHQALIETLQPKVAQKEARKGDARTATKKRNEALEELAEWMKDFKTVVFIAVKQSPLFNQNMQVLERLGFLVKSEGYRPVGRPRKKKQEEDPLPEESKQEEAV